MSINLVCGKTSVHSRERSECGKEIYIVMFEDKDNNPDMNKMIQGTSICELATNLKQKITDEFFLRNYNAELTRQPVKPLAKDEYISLLNLIAS